MIRVYVSNAHGSTQVAHAAGPLELGREARPGTARCVIHDEFVSKDQLRVEELPGNRVRLENLSGKVVIQCADGLAVAPKGARELPLPALLTVGTSTIQVCRADPDADDLPSLRTIARRDSLPAPASRLVADEAGATPGADQLVLWFETLVAVQRAAACSGAFYQEIARAVVELIGLDSGCFLLREGGGWRAVAAHSAGAHPAAGFSSTVLGRVLAERRTFYEFTPPSEAVHSLAGISTVVAAPVFADEGETVIGAVYGARARRDGVAGSGVQPLHAQLVQVLAAAATAGIARMGSEAEAARRHVQFEQFFSRELSAELDRDPGLLTGRDREVTVLVSDVRGFSRISEHLGPRETCDLIADVLDRLTARIHAEGGVVVDYAGDGIMAMWNAPVEQPDHALRACRTALAMRGELPGLNARWAERIGRTIEVGVGVNTGPAVVGNVGSTLRLKYGPLGHTVNLASRVEGVTKQLGVPVLIAGSTRAKLPASFATRRLCRVRVVGIDAPVDLYELTGDPAAEGDGDSRTAYESALALLEEGRPAAAWAAILPLLAATRDRPDRPALALAARIIEALRSPHSVGDAVIALDSK